MPKEENIDFVTLSNDIDYVANILSNIGSKETNMRNILSNLDAQEQDLLHEVELVDLSRSEKTAYVTKLQEVRQKRRKVKNIIELIDKSPEKGKIEVVKSGMFGKEQEKYICPNGHKNSTSKKYCEVAECGQDIKGFTIQETEDINKFKIKTEALKRLMAQIK